MSKLKDAVAELIKRDQSNVSYINTANKIEIISKPIHHSATIKLIDKEARSKRKASVRLDKTYVYPKELEGDVLWDMLLTLRSAIIAHTDKQACESWDNIFGKKWPELLITPNPILSKTKYGYGINANAYIAGYHKAEKKYKTVEQPKDEK